ncbi:unnamed protein product [Phyllotreta striolata]|uniref:Uncharacterized protein n=1 Tax=Phyllotreta striolata TaxID=444603 RepID=A0A9N9TS46_PHYSR|nr:unnamed protein product [Phyllotreta striolata]
MIMFVERNLEIPIELLDKFFYTRLVFLLKINRRETFYCAYMNSRRICTPKQIHPGDSLPKFRPFKDIMNYLDKEAVGYVLTPPHVYYPTRDRSSTAVTGLEVSLLEVFSKLYNFSYELIPFMTVTDDKGSYVEPLLTSIKKGNISWGIGAIFENEKRIEDFDLSKCVFIEGYTAVFSKTFERPELWKFMYKNAMYHVTSITGGICTCMGAYFFLKFRSFRIYVRLIFLPLYEQNQPFGALKSTPMRILFATWWLMCYVLIISYKTYLFGSMFRAPYPINTVEDLVREGFTFKAVDVDYIYIESQCKHTPTDFCEILLPRFTYTNDSCEGLRGMFEEKFAFIGESYTLLYQVNRKCKLSLEEQSQMKSSKNLVFGIQFHVWPMNKNTILTKPLAETVRLLEQAGLYNKWLDNETRYGTFKKPGMGKLRKQRKLRVQDVMLPIYVLLVGYVVSTAAFLLEHYKQKIRKNSILKNKTIFHKRFTQL